MADYPERRGLLRCRVSAAGKSVMAQPRRFVRWS